ncbi:hypothetical protein GF389_04220 [Candidatus Dojkabacteria bacterium]|nr:hypothetical protein [Candidatus Dojkabacteria bacterium]
MSKPHLVILGGIGDTGQDSYSSLMKKLESDFEIVKTTYPGFGDTQTPEKPTLNADVSIIRKNIQSLTTEEVVVFSHSIGTSYAFELCYPNTLNIKALIAANPFTVRNKGLLRPLINGMHERRKLNNWFTKNNIPVEFRPFRLNSVKNLSTYLRTAKIFRNLDISIDLQSLDIPVLALIGDRDRLIPKNVQMQNLELIPKLQVEHFDDGHYFVHTKASKVADLIRKFAKSSGITL